MNLFSVRMRKCEIWDGCVDRDVCKRIYMMVCIDFYVYVLCLCVCWFLCVCTRARAYEYEIQSRVVCMCVCVCLSVCACSALALGSRAYPCIHYMRVSIHTDTHAQCTARLTGQRAQIHTHENTRQQQTKNKSCPRTRERAHTPKSQALT